MSTRHTTDTTLAEKLAHLDDEHGWDEPDRACPVCLEPYAVAGPDGLIPHVLDDHPDSTAAQWVRWQLSRAEA